MRVTTQQLEKLLSRATWIGDAEGEMAPVTGKIGLKARDRGLGTARVEQTAQLWETLAFRHDDAVQFNGFWRIQDRHGFAREAFERLSRRQLKHVDILVNELFGQLSDSAGE